eukprot:CAMPEP_0117419326 /NCGR_PEP_ID=MMETSP0758-20121206/915_1 /TAXON_ID=63605 /ORGANISM="Percolomonas cosmopolitus, Strain AE-1 (ATCC 50343)" /LENGTH=121 /DNA_ID=CAMNT_0005200333 /DNA_START=250 /DNA_END=615 /DNA_ORIENTATION=+
MVDLATGERFSLLLDEEGEIYFTGKFYDSQIHSIQSLFLMKTNFANKFIVSIDATENMAIALDEEGHAHRLGKLAERYFNDTLPQEKIAAISAGTSHLFIQNFESDKNDPTLSCLVHQVFI